MTNCIVELAAKYEGHAEFSESLFLIWLLHPIMKNERVKKVFGSNRVDYYYLIPYPLTLHKGRTTIDWSKNRKDFVVAQLPLRQILDFITDTQDISPYTKVDPASSIVSFRIRATSSAPWLRLCEKGSDPRPNERSGIYPGTPVSSINIRMIPTK
jgi:hypothetical protein